MQIKAYAPAGGFLSPFKLLSQFFSNQDLRLETYFPDHKVYLFNSAKSGLSIFFKSIRSLGFEKPVAVSAYTCPDVISAIVRAGLHVKLLDVEPSDTRISVTVDKVSDCSAVVLSNLYGLVDQVEDNLNVFVVDDACQSALSQRRDNRVGISKNKIGIFSFGRGKAYCGAGGGMLLIPKQYDELNSLIQKIIENIESETFFEFISLYLKSFIYWLLEWPYLYRLVMMLPGTGIGETKVNLNFKIKKGFKLRSKYAFAHFKNEREKVLFLKEQRDNYNQVFSENSDIGIFPSFNNSNNESLTRLPLLLKNPLSQNKEMALVNFGVNRSYQKPVYKYFDTGVFVNSDESFSNSEKVSSKLVTLPMSKYINKNIVNRIMQIISF